MKVGSGWGWGGGKKEEDGGGREARKEIPESRSVGKICMLGMCQTPHIVGWVGQIF